MLLTVRGSAVAAIVGVAALFFTTPAARAACLSDCNNNGSVTAGDLTRIVGIINLCGGPPPAAPRSPERSSSALFTLPAEEGSAQFTGDGANAGVSSDH